MSDAVIVPDEVKSNEELGRRMYSKGEAKFAKRSRTRFYVFLLEENKVKISIDRLTYPTLQEITGIADKDGVKRGRRFYGWAVLYAWEAAKDGRDVLPSPTPENRYHGDISFPKPTHGNRDAQKQHALHLADKSVWRARAEEQN